MNSLCRRVRAWSVQDPARCGTDRIRKIQDHSRVCPACRRFVEESRRVDEDIHRAKQIHVPDHLLPEFWEEVHRKISTPPETTRKHGKPITFSGRPILVWGIPSVVLACILFFLFLLPNRHPVHLEEGSAIFVSVHSATIEGRDARISIFETEDPEMTFLWLETDESINGG